MNELKLRMYSICLYQLNGRQVGIQCGHANDMFANKYENHPDSKIYQDYLKWRRHDMTVILLSAGPSNRLLTTITDLVNNDIPHAVFNEEDLYNQPTAVSFLVDERVWNKEKYPDNPKVAEYYKNFEFYNKQLKLILENGNEEAIQELQEIITNEKKNAVPVFAEWSNFLGGNKNVFLRQFLLGFRLHDA